MNSKRKSDDLVDNQEGRGYQASRFNALRHGILSKHVVLDWEDRAEYEGLLNALVIEHMPRGPTEEHLVEELAAVIWRKRRLRLAERAAHFRALQCATEFEQYQSVSRAALSLAAPDFEGLGSSKNLNIGLNEKLKKLSLLNEMETKAINAFNILSTTDGTYEEALQQFDQNQIDEGHLEQFGLSSRAREYLKHHIETVLFPRYRDERQELNNQQLIRAQVFGESFDLTVMEGLSRYETALDRKFDRVLGTLLKYQALRANEPASRSPPTAAELLRQEPDQYVEGQTVIRDTGPARRTRVRLEEC